jgi:hypothetical protein
LVRSERDRLDVLDCPENGDLLASLNQRVNARNLDGSAAAEVHRSNQEPGLFLRGLASAVFGSSQK